MMRRDGIVGTPAFAKRYVAEQGSDKVAELCQEADSVVVSVIFMPELISTLLRLLREKKLAKAACRKLKADVMAELADVDICPRCPRGAGLGGIATGSASPQGNGCAACGMCAGLRARRLRVGRPPTTFSGAQVGPQSRRRFVMGRLSAINGRSGLQRQMRLYGR
jgi:hypothetical protein